MQGHRLAALGLGVAVLAAVVVVFLLFTTLREQKAPAVKLETIVKQLLLDGRSESTPSDTESGTADRQDIRGCVTDEYGSPVAGAQVREGPVAVAAKGSSTLATSEADGTFTVAADRVSAGQLSAFHPKYTPASGPVVDNRVRIVLGRAGSIFGAVYIDSEPARNVSLRLSDSVDSSTFARTTTGPDGRFQFEQVLPGEWVVSVSGRYPSGIPIDAKRHVIVEESADTQVTFDFYSEMALLEGRVTINGKAPVSFSIFGWVSAAEGVARFSATEGPDGTYRAESVTPGLARVRAEATGLDEFTHTRDAEVMLNPGESHTLNFDFSGGATVFGKVANLIPGANNGVAMLRGHLPPLDPATLTTEDFYAYLQRVDRDVFLDQTGEFLEKHLAPGDYTVIAFSVPGRAREAAAFRDGLYDWVYLTLEEGQELELQLTVQ